MSPDTQLRFERHFDHPPTRVYDAFSTPEALAAWWGPEGFEVQTVSLSFEVGGDWHFLMLHAEYGELPNHIRWTALEPGRRIAYRSLGDGGSLLFDVEITLRGTAEGTALTFVMTFPDAASRDRAVERFGAVRGGEQTLDRLGRLLGSATGMAIEPVGEASIRILRRFGAGVERVFAAFTDPEQIPRWMGSAEAPMSRCEVDLRPGGSLRYEWGPMGLSGVFSRVEPPVLLEHTEVYDEDWTGGEARVTTRFVALGNETQVVMEIRYASGEARDRVLVSPMRDGMAAGFEQLDALLC